MRQRQLAIIGAATMLCSGPLAAQRLTTSPCPSGTTNERIAQDACTQAYDLFQFLAPQLGISLAGGNATLGQGSTLGGVGHFSVGIRANGIAGTLPDVASFQPTTTGAQRRTLPTKDQLLGLPTADAAIGLYKGIPLALTNVGGVDLLLSAAYVPTINDNNVSITPSQNLQLGVGARVGLLQESLIVPGVALTYLRRDLPKTDIIGTTTQTAAGTTAQTTLSVRDARVKTSAWRLVASKSLILFSVAGGIGRDSYNQSAAISGQVTTPVSATATVPGTSQSMSRTNVFVDVSVNLPLFKVVGELGNVSGGTVDTYNSFSGGSADRSLTYFSAGFRLGW